MYKFGKNLCLNHVYSGTVEVNILTNRRQSQISSISIKRIPYHFTCYFCGKVSDSRYLVFESQADKSLPNKRVFSYNVTEKDEEKLGQKADKVLRQMVHYIKNEVDQGIYRTSSDMWIPSFNDECPYCNKHQKWNSLKNKNKSKPEIDWDYDDNQNETNDNSYVNLVDSSENSQNIISIDNNRLTNNIKELIIKNGDYNVYKTLSCHTHINLQNVVSVTLNDDSNLVISQENAEGIMLSERMKHKLTSGVLCDFLLQICDIIDHLQSLSQPLGFITLSMNDIILCENNLLKISNLDTIQFNKTCEDAINLALQMIHCAPKMTNWSYNRLLRRNSNQLITSKELRNEIIEIPNRHKRIMIFFVALVITIALIIRRVLNFF